MSRAATTRLVLALGTAQTLAFASTYYLPAILAVPMARDLGLSTPWVFAAFTGAMLVSALLGPAAGRWIDMHGGRGILALSSLVFAAGLVLLGTATGPVGLGLAWLVIGVGMAIGLYDSAFATLAALYGHAARAPITGITLVAGFASTVGWPLSAWIEADHGWRIACFVWAGLHLTLGLALNLFCVPRGRRPIEPLAAATAEAAESGPAAKPPPAQAPAVAMALLGFVFAATWFNSTAMAAHLPRLLELCGVAATAAVAAAALIGPAQVAARFLEFALLRRVHPMVSARFACMAHPIAVALLLVAGPPAAFAFTLLHGGGNGILTIAKGTLPLVLFGPAGYGLRQGLLSVPTRIAQAASPLAFGLLVEALGPQALLVSAGLGLGAFAALLALRTRGSGATPT